MCRWLLSYQCILESPSLRMLTHRLSLYLQGRECSYSYTIDSFRSSRRTRKCLAKAVPIVFVLLQPFGFLNVMIGLASFLFAALAAIMFLGNRSLGISLEQLSE